MDDFDLDQAQNVHVMEDPAEMLNLENPPEIGLAESIGKDIYSAESSGTIPTAKQAENSNLNASAAAALENVALQEVQFIVPPAVPKIKPEEGRQPRLLKVALHPCGDKVRDRLRMQRVLGFLNSHPGRDRFALVCQENGSSVVVDFPNSSTGITEPLLAQLAMLVGQENISVSDY